MTNTLLALSLSVFYLTEQKFVRRTAQLLRSEQASKHPPAYADNAWLIINSDFYMLFESISHIHGIP
jgi:hypothetical protein